MRQHGAALLAAMLTVALVATFAAAAMWQQWRAVEVESAERARVQSAWLLVGALDWSRLILREDLFARGGDGTDHLAEPWAVPLEEARLSTFLAAGPEGAAAEPDASTDTANAFLSGQITDLQSRLNVYNLVEGATVSAPALRQFSRLFDALGLPQQELQQLAEGLRKAMAQSNAAGAGNTGAGTATGTAAPAAAPADLASVPLMPRSFTQLTWLGLSASTVAALEPYATLLPRRTPVNLNTASAQVLQASIEGLDMAGAQRLVQARESQHFKTTADATRQLGGNLQIPPETHSTMSSYYEVRGRLRLGDTVVEERSLVYKAGSTARTLWRERGAFVRSPAAAR
ncbi:general secretion pathway protein GspK [Paracidovorax avenae]|uniref:type II secretion system minor pseudopilin GspK n=1 Tax=Paracidovorax avenae TaxID=80867 RepID=UPI000D16DA09|nr:type II secretion system minor pseudopilin GspK [Paracidovorax avenae]AVS84077.1 general secretion pathway protein GspK [Paracidovorax avenae]AVS90236.1 general secretion pathway protein GspK [Paracidovorax avenae]AVT01702.1 general secretion pathway protein GspK [Paracidovorax avenae]